MTKRVLGSLSAAASVMSRVARGHVTTAGLLGLVVLLAVFLATALVLTVQRFGYWALVLAALPLCILVLVKLRTERVRQEGREGKRNAATHLPIIEALRIWRLANDPGSHPDGSRAPVEEADGDQRSDALSPSIMERISAAHREGHDLYEIAQGMAKSLHLEEALTFLCGKVARLLHYRCLVVYLYDENRRSLRARFVNGLNTEELTRLEIPLGERLSGWAALHRLPITGRATRTRCPRDGARTDLQELLDEGMIEPLECGIAAPLLYGDDLLGVLALYDVAGRPYDHDHLRTISIVARHVGNGVKSALLYEESHKNALADPLTELPNARLLFVSFEREIYKASRAGAPLSIIVLDINHLKEVNDRFGHPTGDRILRGVARAIRSQMRTCDTCVRYAGDEFIITVPGVGKGEIDRLQERIEMAIAKHKFAVARAKVLRVTVSMGSASYPVDGDTMDELMAVADANMYEQKFAGRERTLRPQLLQRFSRRGSIPTN